MSLTVIIIGGLAAWRLASLFVCEDGPGDIFKRLREISHRYPPAAALLDCVWCASIWTATLVALVGGLVSFTPAGAASVLAMSAVAIIIQRHMEVEEARLRMRE